MAKAGKDYPLLLCSTCAGEYAAGGFRVSYARPQRMIVGKKCSFCGKRVPVYQCRLDGRRPKPRRKTGGA